MQQYLTLLQDILNTGFPKADRTGTGTLSCFGAQMRFDLRDGFPMVTTKKLHLRSIIHELLWFLKGDTNTQYLNDNGVTIWDEWARDETRQVTCTYTVEERATILRERSSINGKTTDWYNAWEKALLEGDDDDAKMEVLDAQNVPRCGLRQVTTYGELGPVYGKQWREWQDYKIVEGGDAEGIRQLKEHGYKFVGFEETPWSPQPEIWMRKTDQIAKVIDQLRNDPDNRRIIVSAWNVGELDQMALAPCHSFFQFYTRELTLLERFRLSRGRDGTDEYYRNLNAKHQEQEHDEFDDLGIPRRQLSCQLYQRKLSCAF